MPSDNSVISSRRASDADLSVCNIMGTTIKDWEGIKSSQVTMLQYNETTVIVSSRLLGNSHNVCPSEWSIAIGWGKGNMEGGRVEEMTMTPARALRVLDWHYWWLRMTFYKLSLHSRRGTDTTFFLLQLGCANDIIIFEKFHEGPIRGAPCRLTYWKLWGAGCRFGDCRLCLFALHNKFTITKMH